jgi:GxxExxY protein
LKKLRQSLTVRALERAIGYGIDTLAEVMVTIENKAVEPMSPLHEAQLLTSMRLRNLRLRFLLN